MSTKLKINIILLAIMAVSTVYFLHLIDMQERIITQYEVEQYERKHPSGKFDLDVFMGAIKTEITHSQTLEAKQAIKELHRYLYVTDLILLISLIVVSKSLNQPRE